MIHRMLRYPTGWDWHVLQLARQPMNLDQALPSRKTSQSYSAADIEMEQSLAEESTYEIKRLFPECAAWLDACEGRRVNHIGMEDQQVLGPVVFGTIMFQASEQSSDVQPFHFWLSKHRLMTLHEDMRLPLRLQKSTLTEKYEECRLAPEAFCIMLGTILDNFHSGLDDFEGKLGELELIMRNKNRTGLIDTIFERRYDLLHWSHLFLPIRELYGAAKEAYLHELTETEPYMRLSHRLERIETLLKHYALEIDTLLSMDDALSSFRGNDIMKTLTIFTVLFLPATIMGTLWGSNFIALPWKDHPWGFIGMIIFLVIITGGMYTWLWWKGWTGDLLKKGHRKPQQSTTDEAPPRSRVKRRSTSNRQNRQNKDVTTVAAQKQLWALSMKDSPSSEIQFRSRKHRS